MEKNRKFAQFRRMPLTLNQLLESFHYQAHLLSFTFVSEDTSKNVVQCGITFETRYNVE